MILVLSACYRCRRIFAFEPCTVPTVVTDARTREPVPMAGPVPPDVINEPLCPSCVAWLVAERKRRGIVTEWP